VETSGQTRRVPVRRLDTLLAQHLIPRADFLKIDVEGFELEVLAGARELIAAGVLGVETESNFGISPSFPNGHFSTIADLLLEHGLLVFDIAFNRVPRASFQRALVARGRAATTAADGIGKPSNLNVLFCRDAVLESDDAGSYRVQPRPLSLDQLIKLIVICELHGLNDIAVDLAERFAERLGSRLDVECAIDLLADPSCRDATHDTVLGRRIREMEGSISWRVTAPLRRLRRALQKFARGA
jgi:hypothetical protein